MKFIKEYNLKITDDIFSLGSYATSDMYLIKNNTIFNFTCYITDEAPDIRINHHPIRLETKVSPIHIDLKDVIDFNSVDVFRNMKEFKCKLDSAQEFIDNLVKSGFTKYKK